MTVARYFGLLVALGGSASTLAASPLESNDTLRAHEATHGVGSVVVGYLSPRGLPPRLGHVIVTDSGLVFRSADGRTLEAYPLAGPVRSADGRRWRVPAISLAYVVQDRARPVYFFRLDGGVFATEGPGTLLDVAERFAWLDTPASGEWSPEHPLAAPGDTLASHDIARRIGTGSYADTLYALFGRPARPIGLVGKRGRNAGRLGEYLARRDSLALDPARMASEDQLRHALAHELGHRWQSRAPAQLAVLWQGVPDIRDPKRYGHGNTVEHQAEAIAFAVHFLQATGRTPPDDGAVLLNHYERLVPGTRLVARYLALQPIYAAHPLRQQLTRSARPSS